VDYNFKNLLLLNFPVPQLIGFSLIDDSIDLKTFHYCPFQINIHGSYIL